MPESELDEAFRLAQAIYNESRAGLNVDLLKIREWSKQLIALASATPAPQEPVAWRQVVHGYLDQGDWDRDTLEALLNDDRLSATPDALDARRYRWLRKNMTYKNIGTHSEDGTGKLISPLARRWYHDTQDLASDTLDAAIDAALASEPHKER